MCLVVCVLILIGCLMCGVFEFINCIDCLSYVESEFKLFEIFVVYILMMLQNVFDVNCYCEMVKCDDFIGFYNDCYFNQCLIEEVYCVEENGSECGLIFFDFDYFKQVNDIYGYFIGSQMLWEVGFILVCVVLGDEFMVVCYGGDEFVIIVFDKNFEVIEVIVEDICECIG